MSSSVDMILRNPSSYELAARALVEMRRCKVWPTSTNFELWIKALSEPAGALATEINWMMSAGEPITDAKSADLAKIYLVPRISGDELHAASDKLVSQIEAIGRTIAGAQRGQADYGRALANATEVFSTADPPTLANLIKTLTEATRLIQTQNTLLEQQLNESTYQVRELQQNLEAVRRDSMTDTLTNLANRKAWEHGIETAVAEAARSGSALTVAVLDIDHFKRFNDTWGHQTGDQVIRYVASVIARLGVAPRLAARYGGEEYAIALPGETAESAISLLEELRVEIASRCLKRRSTNEELGNVTVSIGVAQYHRGESAIALVERADFALYASKRAGRNLITNGEVALQAAG